MVTTDDEDLAWNARSFRDHGYDVKERLNLLELEQKLPYIHNMVGWNYRMTEMQSAIGLAELDRMDTWNMPARRRNAQDHHRRRQGPAAGQVPAHRHARAAKRLVRHGLLAGYRANEVRYPPVRRGGRRRGGALLAGLLAPMPHREGLSPSTRPSGAAAFRSRRRSTPIPPAWTTARSRSPTRSGTRATPSRASPFPPSRKMTAGRSARLWPR